MTAARAPFRLGFLGKLLSALALGVLLLDSSVRASESCGPLKAWDGKPVTLSRHAVERREQRKVGCAALRKTLEACRPFRYRHQGRVKTGCYDGGEKVFVATEGGTVLTIIADPGEDYIRRLKRSAPRP